MAISLTLCWFPAQTIYILSPFGVTQIGSTLQRAGEILAMFNSCVNPLIYWMTNGEYRAGLLKFFMFVKTVEPPFRSGGYTLENQKCSRGVLPSQVKKDTLSLETMKRFK